MKPSNMALSSAEQETIAVLLAAKGYADGATKQLINQFTDASVAAMLRHDLVKADTAVAAYVTRILGKRELDVKKYGVDKDLKNIIELEVAKPAPDPVK